MRCFFCSKENNQILNARGVVSVMRSLDSFGYFVLHLSILLGIIGHMNKISPRTSRRGSSGFTLIEILLAIGILAILATAAIIAINPARQFAQARNTQRWNDIHAIMNAVYQYSVGHKGLLPPEVVGITDLTEICLPDASTCNGIIGVPSLTTEAAYLTALPVDPSCPDVCNDAYSTGYFISTTVDGRVFIQAAYAELDEPIELIR